MKKSARIIDESIMEQKQSFVSRTTDGAAVHRADQNLSCRPKFIVQKKVYRADWNLLCRLDVYRAEQNLSCRPKIYHFQVGFVLTFVQTFVQTVQSFEAELAMLAGWF